MKHSRMPEWMTPAKYLLVSFDMLAPTGRLEHSSFDLNDVMQLCSALIRRAQANTESADYRLNTVYRIYTLADGHTTTSQQDGRETPHTGGLDSSEVSVESDSRTNTPVAGEVFNLRTTMLPFSSRRLEERNDGESKDGTAERVLD